MTRSSLALRSLIHHWRTNLAVLLGVVAGMSVIGGALIVGDSVKSSLRQMTFDRLGAIDFVLSGPRFFEESLATRMQPPSPDQGSGPAATTGEIAPAIVMRAALQSRTGTAIRRAGQVNVYGFDQRAWGLITQPGAACPTGTGVVLNARAAEAIHAQVGDEVTLWIELPSTVPRDTLLGKKDNDSQEITLTVTEIAAENTGLARLGLQPSQSIPLNAFIDLHTLQERLGLEAIKPSRRDPVGQPARVNALLNHDPSPGRSDPRIHAQKLRDALRQNYSLSDLNLRLTDNKAVGGIVLESDQMILENSFVSTAQQTAKDLGLVTSPEMVYLANKIWNPAVYDSGKRIGYSMYSTVAGLDVLELASTPFGGFEFLGDPPTTWAENDVIVNEFLAADLQVRVGDEIRFSYHLMGSRGELPEREHAVTVRGIVKMTGAAVDRALTPQVKGITDVESLADWDQPFPMDLDAVTPRDDEYWDSYRAIPKIFMPLQTAQTLWPSRYGSLTSLRLARSADLANTSEKTLLRDEFTTKLLAQINPVEIGFDFQPVKAIGLMAANGSTDFSGLFFGFSLFLIIAAMILIGLLFRLGVERRVRDLGLFSAVGFTLPQVQRQMVFEGFLIGVAGGVLGAFVAVGYAKLMIYGLTHWWVGAIGTRNLRLDVRPLSLAIGFLISLIAALISIWWGLRHLKQLSPREQLAGVTEKEVDFTMQQAQGRRVFRRATMCSGLALLLMIASVAGLIPAAAAFFGIGILLLIASMSFLSAWLCGTGGIAVSGRGLSALGRLGLRNASRQRQRTVMTAAMIGTATFLIIAVAAFRRDPTSESPEKMSGNGGFTLVAESSSPVLYDLNTAEGRKKLQLAPPEGSPESHALDSLKVIPFRVKPGEDASCLNLYQTRVPTILGVPQSLIDEGRFAFASGSWKELNSSDSGSTSANPAAAVGEATASSSSPSLGAPIPVLGDMNTLMFSLHKSVGATISIPNEEYPQHQLIVKGMFQDSLFQGVLVMSEANFLRLFPEQKGFQYFLIEVPAEQADAAESLLETELAEYGFDSEPVSQRLARFLSVQNTYLSTFQTLGGLGLLLGTFGLATVMMRNVLERQSELALLRSVGFQPWGLAILVLWENALILLWGLFAGAGSAILATSPNLLSRGADLPWISLATLLLIVFATGMLAASFAIWGAIRLPIVATLRGE